MVSKETRQAAKAGEDAFQRWLDRNGFAYVRVRQEQETFARLFYGQVKRPDFLVLIDSIGLLAVDVKNKGTFGKGYSLSHDTECRRAIAFERIFRLPVWYAYCGVDENTWHWISALKAVEVGVERRSTKENESFLELAFEHFAMVRSSEDFGRLYTQRTPLKNGVRWDAFMPEASAGSKKHTEASGRRAKRTPPKKT